MTTTLSGGLAAVFKTARGFFVRRSGTATENQVGCPSPSLHRHRSGFPLAAMLIGAFGALAGTCPADEPGLIQLTEADYPAYATLRLAQAVAKEKGMFAHDKGQQAAIATEFAKACADAGWTKERFEQVDDAMREALGALRDPENAGDELSKTTLATVKAHQKELADYDGLQKRAMDLMQEQAVAAKRGAPPTPEQLAGKWVLDMDLTVASMDEGMGDELKKSVRKTLVAASYTFGPGDRIVATNQRPGMAPETEEGTYRLEGSTLTIKARMGNRQHEEKLNIGIKDGHLRIGMVGFFSVFRRE